MLKLLRKRPIEPQPPCAEMTAGLRVYAIGDVHGRLDLLDDLLAQISADRQSREPADERLIFLGDLVDRGPQSAGVVERVRLLMSKDPSVRCIMGNHEEVLLLALQGNIDALRLFAKIGGRETMASYGVGDRDFRTLSNDDLVTAMRAQISAAHVAFLESLEDQIEFGDYLFVHAGIRPGIPIESQKRSDLRWIRQPFLSHSGDHGKIVVHGHTVTDEVDICPNRVGIDTGAGTGGKLTAVGLEGTSRWFLSAAPGADRDESARPRQAAPRLDGSIRVE